ncbi:class I SAM-dependent methyltransferase [uncultured Thiodictyon sp.]|uniref:class I SAM-dependent methyltransferase n=1 Tax=uncultured Thiodictyon sp. TaxID=1846217 RepID=UPI0025F725A3|nr:class I SAM-dependent methyltransferase [uncultured Thiodictyon sp.]
MTSDSRENGSAHKLVSALVFSGKKLVPRVIREHISEYVNSWRTARSPDRALLIKSILPAFGQTSAVAFHKAILWIGCRRYTKNYYSLLEHGGAQCWTLDLDPRVSQWGRAGRHVVGDILNLADIFPDIRFDVILCNGIFGFGIDTSSTQRRAAEAMATVITPGGWLLLGWNTDRIADPVQTQVMKPWFDQASLPSVGERFVVARSTHVYDIFRRCPA